MSGERETSAPGGTGFDPVPGLWRRVSPRYLVVRLVVTFIQSAIILPIFALFIWLDRWPNWWWWVFLALATLLLFRMVLTSRRVRAIGYLLREDDLLYRRGVLSRYVVSVPYGRMQMVDITRGPLSRALGLAELKLVTAAPAGIVVIPGLPVAEAESLRDHLVAVAETRRAGL